MGERVKGREDVLACLADIQALTLDKQLKEQCVFVRNELREHPIVKDEIVRVDMKNIKALASSRTIARDVFVFTLADFATDIKEIKLLYVNWGFIQGLGPTDCMLYFTFKSHDQRHEFLLRDKMANIIVDKFNLLASLLPRNCVEKYQPKLHRSCRRAHDDSYWSPTGEWSICPDIEKTYQEKIDPLVECEFTKFLDTRNNAQSITVLDIGGGKGRTAEKLLKLAASRGYKLDYTIIEPDKAQCDIARTRVADFSCTVYQGTLQAFKDSESLAKFCGKTEVIISSGGTLNSQVVNSETAAASLATMKQLLSPTGRIIATGISPLTMTSKEMKAKGFGFFTTFPPFQYTQGQKDQLRDVKQLYVMHL